MFRNTLYVRFALLVSFAVVVASVLGDPWGPY